MEIPNGPAANVQLVLAMAILANLIFVFVWDIYCWFQMPPGYSVSYIFYKWAKEFPLLPIAVGILLGHLFFPLRITD